MDANRTSDHDNFHTPWPLFNKINAVLRLNLDVAADPINKKCARYFTKEDDGLLQSWKGSRCWCNEPYSETRLWLYKAQYEARQNKVTIAMLTPAKTERKCWQDVLPTASAIVLISKRIAFPDKGKKRYTAKFPSALLLFNVTTREIEQLSSLGQIVVPWNRRFDIR